MRHEHDNARRHAENTIAEANRHLNSGRIRKPKHHQMLTNMIKDATATLDTLDRMDNRMPYTDTNIGYSTNPRGRGRMDDDSRSMANALMDAVDRILPQITNDMDDMEMRRGVSGTGRGRGRGRVRADRSDRYDMDDDTYDDMDDYANPVDMPRWRSARTGRFLPNLYGPRRVRRVRRRSEMDDRYDDRYDRYDDDARYDADDARQAADEARRAADDARRMADDARRMTIPVMTNDNNRYDDRSDARYDNRNNTRSNVRYESRNDARSDDRSDDATSDRSHRPGPTMR